MDYSTKTVRTMSTVLGDSVQEAYTLAKQLHKGQRRESGELYITHPVAVAKLLFDMGADRDIVCAALLHDVLEDGATKAPAIDDRIHCAFEDHVLYLVQALSKDSTIHDKVARQDVYLKQIKDAFDVDIFVFFIKVADLLHNMSTIVALDPERKKQWIKELKYQYLPLFSTYFHRIPLHYREMYHKMMDTIQTTIDSYDAGEDKSKG